VAYFICILRANWENESIQAQIRSEKKPEIKQLVEEVELGLMGKEERMVEEEFKNDT